MSKKLSIKDLEQLKQEVGESYFRARKNHEAFKELNAPLVIRANAARLRYKRAARYARIDIRLNKRYESLIKYIFDA